MGLLALFGFAWLVGFSGAMAPGPISTMVIAQSARRGFWMGPLITLGHALAELVLVVGLLAGLQGLLAHSRLPLFIALAGGAFVAWMGATTLRDALRGPVMPVSAATDSPQHRWEPVWAGLTLSFSSPYWFVWWTTMGASYVALSPQQGLAGVAAFYSGHILSDLCWNSLLAFLVGSGRRWLPARAMQGFLALSGLFLVGLGGLFVAYGAQMLLAGQG